VGDVEQVVRGNFFFRRVKVRLGKWTRSENRGTPCSRGRRQWKKENKKDKESRFRQLLRRYGRQVIVSI